MGRRGLWRAGWLLSSAADLTNGVINRHLQNMVKPPPPEEKNREDRLAEALRENLRKRKAQSRASSDPAPGDAKSGQP
jgi:hypothetical protein